MARRGYVKVHRSVQDWCWVLLWRLLVLVVKLAVGANVTTDERTKRAHATWFRSRDAVATRPHLNPLRDKPGWMRFGWRVVAVALLYGWVYYRAATLIVLVTIAALVGWRLWVRREHRRYERDVIVPLWAALAPRLGLNPAADNWQDWVILPRDPERPSAVVTLLLPDEFNPRETQETEVNELVARRLRGSWDAEWHYDNRTVSFSRAVLPSKVTWAEIAEDGPEHIVPIGHGARRKKIRLDLAGETPHVLITAPTRWGKTAFLIMLAAWFRMHGALVDIIDPKQGSFQKAFRGVPGIRVHCDIENPGSFARVFADFKEDMFGVYRAKAAGADITDASKYPTRILIVDEMSTLAEMLKIWWRQEGGEGGKPGKGEPQPLIDYKIILWQGGQARFRMIVGAHAADLNTLPGSNARAQFGAKIATGPQGGSEWRMMFGGRKLKRAKVKGRAHLGIGDELTEFQLAYMTEDEGREVALSGPPVQTADPGVPALVDVQRPGQTGDLVPGGATTQTGRRLALVPRPRDEEDPQSQASVPRRPPEELIVGVADGAAFLGLSYSAFDRARKRDKKAGRPIEGEISIGGSPAWTPTALRNWQAQRPIAGKRRSGNVS